MHIQYCLREFHGEGRAEQVDLRRELQKTFQIEETI